MMMASTAVPSLAEFEGGDRQVSGGQTYWEKMGRPNDREGRQLSVYFDLNDLERNRAQVERTSISRTSFLHPVSSCNRNS